MAAPDDSRWSGQVELKSTPSSASLGRSKPNLHIATSSSPTPQAAAYRYVVSEAVAAKWLFRAGCTLGVTGGCTGKIRRRGGQRARQLAAQKSTPHNRRKEGQARRCCRIYSAVPAPVPVRNRPGRQRVPPEVAVARPCHAAALLQPRARTRTYLQSTGDRDSCTTLGGRKRIGYVRGSAGRA